MAGFFRLGTFGLGARSAGGFSLDFTGGSLPSGVTFTRASSGTYFDSNGVMQTAATDTPRFNYEYNGSSWVAKGLRIEPAATNLLIRAREFDNASWTKTDITVTANAANGVGGTATMDRLTEGVGGISACTQVATITSNSTNTFAVDLKRGNTDWIRVLIFETATTANRITAWFNLNTGATGTASNGGTGSGATASIRNLGGGIYRCILTGAVNNSATAVSVQVASTVSDLSVTRVNNATYYLDRAQLEAGSVATSFIETTTATATRAADVALVSGSNFSSFYNPTEGTFVVEVSTNSAAVRAITVSAGALSNQLFVQGGGHPESSFQVYTSSAFVAQIGTIPAVETKKIAAAYKQNDFAVSINGAAVATDTSGNLATYDRLHLGTNYNGTAGFLNGHISRITYYPVRLSNAQLVTLST